MLNRILGARQSTPAQPRSWIWTPSTSIATGSRLSEDQAMSYSAFWAGVSLIARTVAMLPWRHFRETGDHERELMSGSAIDRLLNRQPNPDMTPFQFREFLQTCALVTGNGYAEIVYNRAQQPIELWPVPDPLQVTPKRDDSGKLYYELRQADGGIKPIPARFIFHHRGPTIDGIVGRSLLSLARDSIGIGIASEQFAAGFLGNGGTPSYVIVDGPDAAQLDPEGVQNMLESFERRHKGAKNAGRPAYLEAGRTIQPIGIPHKDAQFLEQRKFQVNEMARWLGLPPHKLGDLERASFSNIEEQNIDFVVNGIMPWTVRLEQEAGAKLVQADDEYTKINLLGLLRGDSESRAEFYTRMFNMAAFSPNDILELEDRNPVEGGDQRFVPLNMVPLDRASDALEQRAAGGRAQPSGEGRGRLLEAYGQMIRREVRAVERMQEGGGAQTPEQFYRKHAYHMRDALREGVEIAAKECGADPSAAQLALHAQIGEHVDESMRDIASGAWRRWKDNRTQAAVSRLLERIASC